MKSIAVANKDFEQRSIVRCMRAARVRVAVWDTVAENSKLEKPLSGFQSETWTSWFSC